MEPSEADRLKSVGDRIETLRAGRKPKRSAASDKVNIASYAWRMVTELVVGVMIGVGVGLGLDTLTGWAPLFLLVFGGLGFAAGINVLLRTANEMTRIGARENRPASPSKGETGG